MKAKIFVTWDRLHSSFWFVPFVMVALALGLGMLTLALDRAGSPGADGLLLMTAADTASGILETIATSMVTIASVVFSIMLVALSLASRQFGPRLIGNYMRDKTTQSALGVFVSTYLYCLIILHAIRSPVGADPGFVPHLSVNVALLMALLGIGVLIYFIHHISVSIQANEIVGRISSQLNRTIDHDFPEEVQLGDAAPSAASAAFPDVSGQTCGEIPACKDGYLQLVDSERLTRIAEEHDFYLQLQLRPGDYVTRGRPLALLHPAGRANESLTEKINAQFVVGNQRTPGQDVEFMIRELVEIAVRALSPSLNDPYSAVSCVDHLGSALCRLTSSARPSGYRHDSRGIPRLHAPVLAFPELLDAGFNDIREYGRESVPLTLRLLEVIERVAATARRAEDFAALGRHADMIIRGARGAFAEEADLQTAEERYERIRNRLQAEVTENAGTPGS